MDEYESTKCGIEAPGKRKKLILFRLPKDVDINMMNGLKIKLPKNMDEKQQISMDGTKFSIKMDAPILHASVRPILSTSKTNIGALGDPFYASYSVTRVTDFDPNNKEPSTNPAMTIAYSRVPQRVGLAVRHMPFGSTTTVEEVSVRTAASRKRLAEEAEKREDQVKDHKPKKSRKSVEPGTEERTHSKKRSEDRDIDGVDKSAKKKSKKSKKSSE